MRHRLFVLVVFAVAVLSGCFNKPNIESAQRFDVVGKVVSVDASKKQVTVAHEAIPNFMDAMTMPFFVKDAWALDAMAPGDTIRATLVVADNRSWLEGISVAKSEPGTGPALPPEMGTPKEPSVGSSPPSTPFVNQDGTKLTSDQLRGKATLVTFVYTRCPLPDQCPLMTQNFATVNKALAADPALAASARLLTVSIDPAADTPALLKAYGEKYAGVPDPFARWDFVTGDIKDIRPFAEYFGLLFREEEGQIVHSLRTALLDKDGKLVKIYRGNDWKPDAIVADISQAVRK